LHKPCGFFGLSCHYFSHIVCNLFIIETLQDGEMKKKKRITNIKKKKEREKQTNKKQA